MNTSVFKTFEDEIRLCANNLAIIEAVKKVWRDFSSIAEAVMLLVFRK